MTRLGSPLKDVRAAALIVGVLGALVYANSLWNQFTFDDVHIIVDNEALHRLATIPGTLVEPYWPVEYGRELGLWRPVTTGVYGLLYVAGGGSPWLFHLTNVLAHAATCLLVLLLGATLVPLPAALAAGLLFAVHPVHVEAVSNIVGFAELLSTAAIAAACLVHVRGPQRVGWGRALGLGALYALAFGAKESGVVLPGLLFLLDAARQRLGVADLREYLRDRWRVYVVAALVAVALLAGRVAVLGSVANPLPPLGGDLLTEVPRIWTLGEVWTHYVRLWVLPLDLYADYSPLVIPISLDWHLLNAAGAASALAILTMALLAWRRGVMGPTSSSARVLGFGVVWFVIAIAPTSNTIFLSGVILAERTLYLPSLGLALATGWLGAKLFASRPKPAAVLLAAVLVLASVRTWTRTPTWRDNNTFFATLLNDAPQSGRSQWILADEFLKVQSISQAMLTYRLAINILGGHYVLLTDISRRLIELERFQAAEGLLNSAWEQKPDLALAPALLAWVRAQSADAMGTERFARASLALYDEDVTRQHLLAWSLAAQGRWDDAAEARSHAEALPGLRINFWHVWMYEAYARRHLGDTLGTRVALDSAWASAATVRGRQAMDSVRVADFGLTPLLAADTAALDDSVNR